MSVEMYMFMLLLVATCFMLFISYLSFFKRQLPIAKYSALVMLTASFYSLGYAFEIISTNLDNIKFWMKVEYIGIPFISTFWLILVIHYTGHQAILKKWVMLLLFAIPVTTLILHYTNDMHHFYYSGIEMDESNTFIQAAHLLKGPWYWVHIFYNYLQAAVGMILFAAMYLKAMPIVRKQIMIMMLGALMPWLSNIVYLFGDFRMNLDLTPLGFTLTGLFYIWGIYRFNLLRLVPIAMQTVFETMQDGVIILDYDNNVTSVNQAAKDIFGKELQHNSHTNSVYNVLSEFPEILTKLSDPENNENRISIHREEKTLHYVLKISIIHDKGQVVLGKMLLFNDVTQVVVYQEKLLSNANQLAELNAFKDKLFTVVAHDIRDPLAVLINLTELLEEELKAVESKEWNIFHEVSEQVRNTYMLVENLLDWFRSQKGKIIFRPLMWDLTMIVQQAVHSLEIRSDTKKIKMIFSMDDEMLVFADKEMLELVLRNLLSNAVKFTKVGGHIYIEATRVGERVTVSVRDSGVGVDPRITKTLFHEVQQVSSSGTEGEKGSGLGLFLAGKFVQMNGGEIWLKSVPGQGSTFYFTLPTNSSAGGTQTRIGQEIEFV